MNPRINYTLVGAFVVLLTLAGLIFISWMSPDSGDSQRLPYVTYFSESVSGLNERAAVKYKGVPVGFVEKISLVTYPVEKVELKLRLDPELQLHSSTYASLKHQGITGLLFVELQSNGQQGELITTSESNPAVLASQGSRLVELTDNLGTTMQNFSELAVSLNELTKQLTSLTSFSMQDKVENLLGSIDDLSRLATERLEDLDPKAYQKVLEELGAQGQLLQENLSQELKALSQEIQNFSQDSQVSARLLQPLLLEAQDLASQLRQESNSWLRGNKSQPKGPGEN